MNDRMFDAALVRPAREGAERFLRLALKLDAVATGAVGALALVAAPMLDDLFGTPIALLRSVGLVLVVYAAAIWFSGTRRTLDRAAAWAAVTLNVVWVIACVAVVATGPFALTIPGSAFILAQAAVVAMFADLQFLGLRRARMA